MKENFVKALASLKTASELVSNAVAEFEMNGQFETERTDIENGFIAIATSLVSIAEPDDEKKAFSLLNEHYLGNKE